VTRLVEIGVLAEITGNGMGWRNGVELVVRES
jgi:hypothetical protein